MSTFLTTREAAEILRLSPRTLKNWRNTGKGPRFIKLTPRAVRYSTEDVMGWAETKPKLFVSSHE